MMEMNSIGKTQSGIFGEMYEDLVKKMIAELPETKLFVSSMLPVR